VIRHAGLLALRVDGEWRGALVEGPSGSGKSDLALRALDAGWSLVADDRTLLWTCADRLFGRAPDPLVGLMEVRGLGVLATSCRPFAEVRLVVRCVDTVAVDRTPDPAARILLGVELPWVGLAAREASATAKLGRALTRLGVRP
jgi:serine kinase of HPr protein (carbohydrate metabolism regulator)